MPDYHLYDDYVNEQLSKGISKTSLKYYTDYSIGFLTRGCFRQCSFCVNKNYTKCVQHSPLKEFYDSSRPKICLLDDNFFACPKWKDIMVELKSLNIPFQFRQGLDERLLTDEKCKMLFSSKYDGDFIFAFDDINDKELIENKLQIINKYFNNKRIKFYVLCGYDRNGKYDLEFWKQDLFDLFERINILLKHKARPYIMRHENYKSSPYNGTYIHVARWCNQINMLKKMSYREFCYLTDSTVKSKSSCLLYFEKVENEIPELASKYFDMKLLNFEKGCCNF